MRTLLMIPSTAKANNYHDFRIPFRPFWAVHGFRGFWKGFLARRARISAFKRAGKRIRRVSRDFVWRKGILGPVKGPLSGSPSRFWPSYIRPEPGTQRVAWNTGFDGENLRLSPSSTPGDFRGFWTGEIKDTRSLSRVLNPRKPPGYRQRKNSTLMLRSCSLYSQEIVHKMDWLDE